MPVQEGLVLSVVLPVYNEGEAVEPVLRALSAGIATPHELVVVYDFDADTTVPVVTRLTGEIPGLRGLRNDLGRGVLNAMKAGIAGTDAPYVLISISRQLRSPPMPVGQIGRLARRGADVVAASRYMRGGHQVGGPLIKRLMSRVAGLTLHWFAGVPDSHTNPTGANCLQKPVQRATSVPQLMTIEHSSRLSARTQAIRSEPKPSWDSPSPGFARRLQPNHQ